MVTIPEWGHLSPFINVAESIQRQWDDSKGVLELSLASMEQVRSKVEARGIEFVSIGAWDAHEAELYARASKATFDPHVSVVERMRWGTTGIMQMNGLKMGAALLKHLEAAKEAGSLPDVIVTDGLTSAGFDAAEKFKLPLAVIWPFPLSIALKLAGYGGHTLPANVPLEFLHLNTAEDAHPLIRHLVNPVAKRAVLLLTNTMFGRARRAVRQQLGLPALSAPDLRRQDGTPCGVLSGWKGPLAVQPAVPRAMYLAGVTWELNAKRELPPCWHMVGPLVIDRHNGDFPPKFGPEDAAVEAFLQAAADAGEPVVFTAAGSMTHLTQQQIDALLETFNTLTTGSSSSSGGSSSNGSGSGSGRVRVLWALRSESQQLLPPHLRSAGSNGSSTADGASKGHPAAPAATAAAADLVGDSTDSSNERLMVSAWVKQTAVLAHPSVKVFLTHGGLGSVHEALALGQAVPLVVPFSNGADHVTIGQQLANRGLGIMLKPWELSQPGKLLAAVQDLLHNPDFSRSVGQVAQQWEKAGYGPKMASELLMEFAMAPKQQQ